MIIGIISDTHGLLRKEVIDELKNCNSIIHAGDVGKLEIIEELNKIARTEYVRGNCDKNIDLSVADKNKIIDVIDKRIYLLHDIKDLNIDLHKEKIDIVVFGHSHKTNIYENNGIIYINPGSIGPKRFKLPTTMVKLNILENKNKDIHIHTNLDNIYKINNCIIEIITFS